MSNFKSQAKRKRELAKLDKRHAKEQKRAIRKAERSGAEIGAPAAMIATAAPPALVQYRSGPSTAPVVPVRTPMTLAEAAERWKNTKVVKPKKRY